MNAYRPARPSLTWLHVSDPAHSLRHDTLFDDEHADCSDVENESGKLPSAPECLEMLAARFLYGKDSSHYFVDDKDEIKHLEYYSHRCHRTRCIEQAEHLHKTQSVAFSVTLLGKRSQKQHLKHIFSKYCNNLTGNINIYWICACMSCQGIDSLKN